MRPGSVLDGSPDRTSLKNQRRERSLNAWCLKVGETDCSFSGGFQARLSERTGLVALHGVVDEQQEAGDGGEEQELHPHGHSASGFGPDARWCCGFGDGQRDGQVRGAEAGGRSALCVG